MKVLGETKDGFIVEMTSDESANVQGLYSKHSTGYIYPKVGDIIKVKKVFCKIENIRRMEREYSEAIENIEKIKVTLLPLKDLIEKSKDEINEPTK